jgi:transposase
MLPRRWIGRLRQTVWTARRLARKLARVAVGMGPAVEPQLREAPDMSEGSWVGLDVHARSVVAGVIDQGSGEVRSLRLPAGGEATVAWLSTLPAPVHVVYEAGPTGYRLARVCAEAGINCVVAAPSRVRAAADRVKTDRRDAERLARLLRLGEITAVRIPTLEEEAARDLVRAREDARGDLMRARHRLSKLLLRHGLVYEGTAWTRAHDGWLRRQRFQGGPLAIVFDECYGRMLDAKTRRDALDTAIAELAATPPYVEVVSRLVCLRGVSTLTGFALSVELGDWHRFRPESLGPFLGLTPSEHSSGERRRQGGISKTGNSHVRRLLIEAAWHQRRPPRRSVTLERRRDGKPLAVQAQAERAAPAGCTDAGRHSRREASRARSSWSRSRASSPDTAGRWRRWTRARSQRLGEESAAAQRREERPEGTL